MTDAWIAIGNVAETFIAALERLCGVDADGYLRGPAVFWQLADEWESWWYGVLELSLARDDRIAVRKYDKLRQKH